MTVSNDIGRRGALGLIGVAAIAGAASATPVKGSAPLDLTSPSDRLKAYMMMRGALDDRLVIGCVSGQYFGVVDDALTPLFGVVSATFARYRPRPGGGYDGVTLEYAYFTDLETGKALGKFRNPYTGMTVEVPGGGYAPSKIAILPDLSLVLGRSFPGATFEHTVLPVEVRGDDVWFSELTRTSRTVPGEAKPFHYSEMVIEHARRGDLETPGARRVPCETSFTGVVSWRPWLKMGDRPGHLMATGSGRYGATMETLPPAWTEATRAQHPDLLANPAALLDPVWKTLG